MYNVTALLTSNGSYSATYYYVYCNHGYVMLDNSGNFGSWKYSFLDASHFATRESAESAISRVVGEYQGNPPGFEIHAINVSGIIYK